MEQATLNEETDPPRATGLSNGARSAIEWVLVIGGALAVALVIRAFLFTAFSIPSESMEPTLAIGDRVIVNQVSYLVHDVNRGDVIVFARPPALGPSEIEDLVKRVVGLEGETVEAHDGFIYVNGRRLTEPYLLEPASTSDFSPVVVPEGHVFVLGDNRRNSEDSRYIGPVDMDLIVGRAFVRAWPTSRWGLL